MNGTELIDLPLKEYFDYFNNNLHKNMVLEYLEELFTELPHKEYKPYLIRRSLIPKDKRFRNIEIVYDDTNGFELGAIVWEINFTLRELVDIFGKPKYNYVPYNDTVEFAFISLNPDIEIIKTRLSLSKINNNEYNKLKLIDELSNWISDFHYKMKLNFINI